MNIARLVGIFILIVSFNFSVNAQKTIKKESFKVWGNCGMCKKTIDKAANSVEGVVSASWSEVSLKMKVKYNSSKTTLDAIKKAIAKVGYDTEEYRSDDETYSNLHHCCQYERPKKIE